MGWHITSSRKCVGKGLSFLQGETVSCFFRHWFTVLQEGQSPGLIATPEIVSEAIDEELEFIILATDGLWDVVHDQVCTTHRFDYLRWRSHDP